MSLTELFIIAVGLSMDAFAVAVCKGLAMPEMSWKNAGIVGLYFGGFQGLMPFWDICWVPSSAEPSSPMTTGSPLCFSGSLDQA